MTITSRLIACLLLLLTVSTQAADGVTIGQITFPRAVITIDGDGADWAGIAPIITDPRESALSGTTLSPARDIVAVYAAADDNYVYWRIDVAGSYALTGEGNLNAGPTLNFWNEYDTASPPAGSTVARIESRVWGTPDWFDQSNYGVVFKWYGDSEVAASERPQGYGRYAGGVAEMRIPRSAFSDVNVYRLSAYYFVGNSVAADQTDKYPADSSATLQKLEVSGPSTLAAGTSDKLTATAIYTDGLRKPVTPTWTSSHPALVPIAADGTISPAAILTNDLQVTIAASYTENGTTITVSKSLAITARPPLVADTTPDPFSFLESRNTAPEELIMSEAIVVRGINTRTPITISDGEYSINNGPWTSSAGTVGLGNVIRVRLTAPAAFASSRSTTLTIGDVSATFTVNTRSFTAVSAPTQVFTNPQTAEVTDDGFIRFRTVPGEPIQFAPNALPNAVIRIDDRQTLPVTFGTATLRYTPASDSTRLQVQTINGAPGLVPIAGRVAIEAPTAQSTIPVVGDDSGSASLQTSSANTRVITGRNDDRNVVIAITSGGKVTYRNPSRTRALPTSFDVYPGEAVIADESGNASQVRLGSFAQDESATGDLIANLPNTATTLQVPYVAGTSSRFGERNWGDLIGQAITETLALGTYQSLSQNSRGVLTLTTSSGIYRFLPVGNLGIAESAISDSRAVSVTEIAANLMAILDQNLSFAVAPATDYADLATAIQAISPGASLEILGDGVLLATIDGTSYIAQPAAATTAGSTEHCPGFVTENNHLALCDSSGRRQLLNAAFADTDTLRDTFRTELSVPDLSVTNMGNNGTYAANISGTTYTLVPEIVLTSPPSEQDGQLWWIDENGKIFIRYPNGSAQGFALQ